MESQHILTILLYIYIYYILYTYTTCLVIYFRVIFYLLSLSFDMQNPVTDCYTS